MGEARQKEGHWPRFRQDEVVRVVRVADWNRLQDRLGATGTVLGCQPDQDNRGWTVCVEFADIDDYDDYWEDQVESTGLLEVHDEAGLFRDRLGEPVSQVPLPEIEPAEEWGSELFVRIHLEASDHAIDALLARAKEKVAEIAPTAEIDAEGARSEDDEHRECWNLTLSIGPWWASRDNFERLIATYDGWQIRYDSGWDADFSWWGDPDDPTSGPFGIPEARNTFVELTPWSDPQFRPVPPGRNDGLDGHFVYGQSLPPPAGYR